MNPWMYLRDSPDTDPWFGMGLLRPKDAGGIDCAMNSSRRTNSATARSSTICSACPHRSRPNVVVPEEDQKWAADWWDGSPLRQFKAVVGMICAGDGGNLRSGAKIKQPPLSPCWRIARCRCRASGR